MPTTHVIPFTSATGRTLYAYPHTQSLADYATHRVQAVESVAPNLGQYTLSLDSAVGTFWEVFEGATQPTAWSESLQSISLSLPAAPSATAGGLPVLTSASLLAAQVTLASTQSAVTVFGGLDVTGAEIKADVEKFDGDSLIDGYNPAQVMAIMLAALAGKISGSSSNAPVIRSVNDDLDRILATTTSNGDRTAITINVGDH